MHLLPEPEEAICKVILHWSNIAQLADFAEAQHGFGDTNGGFGATYPGDLDPYHREVDGMLIPEGFVEICGFWGSPEGYEILVPESYYQKILSELLSETGHREAAERVRQLYRK